MKNTILLILLLIVGFTACMKESDNKKEKNSLASPEKSEKVDILIESGLKKYLSLPPNTTWQDLDAFYLKGVEKYRDRPQLNKFKCTAIIFLVNMYQLVDDQSDNATERIEYYAQEMASLDNCNPEVLYAMLMRLQGRWESSKIAQVASLGYNNSIRVTNLLDKNSSLYTERIKDIEDLKSLFEAKN